MIPVLDSQPAGDVSHKPCRYCPPGLQLPLQPLRGLLPILLLGGGYASTRKIKLIWILLKQETVSGSGISWAICKPAPRSGHITMPASHHSIFTGRMPFLPPNQQRQGTEETIIPQNKMHGYVLYENRRVYVDVKAVATVFLKSQFEFGRGNYEKAVRMLSSVAGQVLNQWSASSVIACGPLRNAAAMYFNDLGVAHFHLRKHNLGAFYLRRAAEENTKTVREMHGGHDGRLELL